MLRKHTHLILGGVIASLMLSSVAHSQVSGSLTLTSDYVSRGITQGIHADNDPAAIGYLEYSQKGFYAAVLGANVDFGDGTDLELDVFAGYRTAYRGWNFDYGVVSINYPTHDPGNLNMLEAKATAGRTYARTTLGGTVGFTPDYYNVGGPSVWVEATTAYQLTEKLSVSGAVGYQAMEEQPDQFVGPYGTANIGVKYSITPTFAVDTRYHATDREDLGSTYRDRVAVSLTKGF